jgi:hypothetical protein
MAQMASDLLQILPRNGAENSQVQTHSEFHSTGSTTTIFSRLLVPSRLQIFKELYGHTLEEHACI